MMRPLREPLAGDADVALVAACLRPPAAGRSEAVARAAGAGFDPDRVVALAHRHRVAGSVARSLAAADIVLPPDPASRLAEMARTARVQALRNAGEEVRLGRALAAAGIDALFLKGATLAMRAYGTLGLKSSWDIDVLVARDRMEAAGTVLAALGYRLSILGGVTNPVHVRRYLAAHKEAEWHHAARGTVIELHTELSDVPTAIAGIGLGSPRTSIELMPGERLDTLALAPLFAYLAYHGTSHLWGRLKWLADIAALLDGEDVEALYREAVALGAGRTPGVAIALAADLLGMDIPPALLAETRRDRATRRLLRYSHAAIAMAPSADGTLMRPLRRMIGYTRAQAWLVPGPSHRWAVARGLLTAPYHPAHLRVPRWARPVVILGILPARMLRRWWRRRQAGGKVASRP